MIKFFKSLNLRWSDLFLLVGIGLFSPFLIFEPNFITNSNANDVNFPLAAIIVCFILSFASWITYIVLENKRGNFKKGFALILLSALAVINVIVICCQPSEIKIEMEVMNQPIHQIVPLLIKISSIHKLFFSLEIVLICFALFIGFTVLPKRFKSVNAIQIICWIGLIIFLIFIIYSYISEANQYAEFIKHLFGGSSLDELDTYTVKSFTVHSNGYGLVLLFALTFAIISHSIRKHFMYYLIMMFIMINMFFTLNKGSLIVGALIILAYCYFRLITTFKENKKRNAILLGVLSAVLITLISLVIASVISKGEILGFLYSEGFFNSLKARSYIWKNTFQNLSSGKWLIGRGYGIINMIIYPMNQLNGDSVYSTHNIFVSALGEGGIIFLLGLLLFIGYMIYCIKHCWKNNQNIVFALALGLFAFLVTGFIESNQGLLFLFSVLICILKNISRSELSHKLQ